MKRILTSNGSAMVSSVQWSASSSCLLLYVPWEKMCKRYLEKEKREKEGSVLKVQEIKECVVAVVVVVNVY